MSTAVLSHPLPIQAAPVTGRSVARLVAFALALIFLTTEHDWSVSLADSYTSTADEMEAAAGGGNSARRIAFLSLGAIGVAGLTLSRRSWRSPSVASFCFAFFVGWCGISALWSIDMGMTIRRLFVLGCFLVGAVGLGRGLSAADLMKAVIMVSMTTLAIGVCAEVSQGTFHPAAGDYRFAGTQHPNTTALSLSAVSIAAFCLWRSGERTLTALILFAVSFGFLVLTKSRTSAAGVLAALLFLWTLSTPFKVKFGVAACLGWVIGVGVILVLLSGWSIEDDVSRIALMGREEQSESLTGRIPIWTELSPWIGRRLLTGYGYDSFWTPDHIDRVSRELQWGIREAHSAYMDLALSVGILAAAALLVGLALGMRRAAALYLSQGRPEHGFILGLQLFCLINALTESAMVMPLFIPFIAASGMAHVVLNDDEACDDRDVRSVGGCRAPLAC